MRPTSYDIKAELAGFRTVPIVFLDIEGNPVDSR